MARHLLGSSRFVPVELISCTEGKGGGSLLWVLCFSCHRWGHLGSRQLVLNVIHARSPSHCNVDICKAAVVLLLGKDPLSSAEGEWS